MQGCDTHSTTRILCGIVRLCFSTQRFDLLNEQILALSKRRSQIKQSVTEMIKLCCTYVDSITDEANQLKLIETLRSVTAGKIYVEVERARLTFKLAQKKEAEGKVSEAATIMQELQVETYGSMNKKEKIELILEQIRLCLATKDYVRTRIISKKILTKHLEDAEMGELKLKYYKLMIALDEVDNDYLSVCKHYLALFNTEPTAAATAASTLPKTQYLKHAIVYIVLTPYDNEQSDCIHRIRALLAGYEDLVNYSEICQMFTSSELINWAQKESYLRTVFVEPSQLGEAEREPTNVFLGDPTVAAKRWQDLKSRVVEHVSFSGMFLFQYWFTIVHSRISASWPNFTAKSI